MSRLRNTKDSRRRSFFSIEALESRWTMDGDSEGVVWGESPYLSVSFVPDGTQVAGQSSQLFSSLNQIATPPEWQQAVITALQTWVVHVNGDVALTSDDGSPLGTEGESQGDPRFGDIRVAAIPMRRNVYALAIARGFVSGTWAGDIVFNSNRIARQHPLDIDSLDAVFRVALHEGGHVFGLEDNGLPDSPMQSHGIPAVVTPSGADIQQLQNRFGVRAPDGNEFDEHNNSIDQSTRLESSDDFVGSFPHIVFGDISAGDVDVFELNPIDNAAGPVTFTVRTESLSSLQPQLAVLNRFGVTLASTQSMSTTGDIISVTISSIQPEEKYYAVVTGTPGGAHAVGGYALIATYDQFLQTSPQGIDRFSGPEFRFLNQDDIQDFFANDDDGDLDDINDDVGTNDDPNSATILESTPGYIENTRYTVEASLANGIDQDFYRIRSPQFNPLLSNTLTILVRGGIDSTMSPRIQVMDSSLRVLSTVPLVRHGRETILQVLDIQPEQNYYIRLQDPLAIGNGTSNYRLTALLGADPQSATSEFAQALTSSFREHEILFSRAVLIAPSILGSATNDPQGLWSVAILSSQGQVVDTFVGDANDYQSAPSLYLPAGRYRFRITAIGMSPSIHNPQAYRFRLAVVTDPLSVPLVRGTRRTIKRVEQVNNDFVFPDPKNPTLQPPATQLVAEDLSDKGTSAVDHVFGQVYGPM